MASRETSDSVELGDEHVVEDCGTLAFGVCIAFSAG